jgi:hypothetical protein
MQIHQASEDMESRMSTDRSAPASRGRTRSKREEQSWLNSTTLYIVGGVLAVIIAAPIVMNIFGGDDTPAVLEGHVQEMPDEGRDHVAEGTTVEYDSEPPTSGPHYASWAPAGIHREVVADEYLVHNLEHGHIVIYYTPDTSRLSDESVAKITELTEEFDGQWDAVLAVPRPDMDAELTLTAWNHKMELDSFDEELIDAFVEAYRGRGPENPIR